MLGDRHCPRCLRLVCSQLSAGGDPGVSWAELAADFALFAGGIPFKRTTRKTGFCTWVEQMKWNGQLRPGQSLVLVFDSWSLPLGDYFEFKAPVIFFTKAIAVHTLTRLGLHQRQGGLMRIPRLLSPLRVSRLLRDMALGANPFQQLVPLDAVRLNISRWSASSPALYFIQSVAPGVAFPLDLSPDEVSIANASSFGAAADFSV